MCIWYVNVMICDVIMLEYDLWSASFMHTFEIIVIVAQWKIVIAFESA